MKSLTNAEQLGIHVSKGVASVAQSDRRRIVFEQTIVRNEGESIDSLLLRLIPPRRRFARRPAVVAIVDSDSLRAKYLRGLPAELSSDNANALIRLNYERFFVSPFEKSMVSTVVRTNDAWLAAVANAEPIQELSEALARQRLSLLAAVPGDFVLRSETDDAFGEAKRSVAFARAAAEYRTGSAPEFIPRRLRGDRGGVSEKTWSYSIIVAVAATVVAWTVPESVNNYRSVAQSDSIDAISGRQSLVRAQLDSIRELDQKLSAVQALNSRYVRVIQTLALLDSVLPEDAVLEQFRMDSTGVEFSVRGENPTEIVSNVSILRPDVELIGSITSDPSASERPRVVLQLPSRQGPRRAKPRSRSTER